MLLYKSCQYLLYYLVNINNEFLKYFTEHVIPFDHLKMHQLYQMSKYLTKGKQNAHKVDKLFRLTHTLSSGGIYQHCFCAFG